MALIDRKFIVDGENGHSGAQPFKLRGRQRGEIGGKNGDEILSTTLSVCIFVITTFIVDLLQLKQFSLQLLHRKIQFTANGYFTLDNTLFHSVRKFRQCRFETVFPED